MTVAPAPTTAPADPWRAAVVAETRRWLGTPYAHQAAVRGVGCDCLGLVLGVWRALGAAPALAPPPYTPDWSEYAADEGLLAAARAHLIPLSRGRARPGDVLVFRMRAAGPAKHLAILSAPGRLIHAATRRGVVEIPYDAPHRRRAAAVFALPPPPA